MTNFSEIPWIAEHIELYRTDPKKAHMWDSSLLGGPGPLPGGTCMPGPDRGGTAPPYGPPCCCILLSKSLISGGLPSGALSSGVGRSR